MLSLLPCDAWEDMLANCSPHVYCTARLCKLLCVCVLSKYLSLLFPSPRFLDIRVTTNDTALTASSVLGLPGWGLYWAIGMIWLTTIQLLSLVVAAWVRQRCWARRWTQQGWIFLCNLERYSSSGGGTLCGNSGSGLSPAPSMSYSQHAQLWTFCRWNSISSWFLPTCNFAVVTLSSCQCYVGISEVPPLFLRFCSCYTGVTGILFRMAL